MKHVVRLKVPTGSGTRSASRWLPGKLSARKLPALVVSAVAFGSLLPSGSVAVGSPGRRAAGQPAGIVAGGVNLSSSVEQGFVRLSAGRRTAIMHDVRASGATWIRIALPMPGDEYSPGNFTWYSDTEVRAALAAGLHVDGLVGWPAQWALRGDGSPDMGAWARFAEVAAHHYSAMGVTTFEMWNEPNTRTQWGPRIDVAAYAALLRSIYPVIKRQEPHVDVMLGGLAPVADAGDGSAYSPMTFLADLYRDGAGGSFDSVGLHPYSYPFLPARRAGWNPWTYLPQLHALMSAHGDGRKRIWYTEFGAPVGGNRYAVSPAAQAQSFVQAFEIARRWWWSGPLFAYNWVDWDGDGSGWYGLHTGTGQPRPALWAFEWALRSRVTLREEAVRHRAPHRSGRRP